MNIISKKTIIFLNVRFSDFYSKDLFRQIKEDEGIRLVAVLDDQFKDKINPNVSQYLDHVYEVSSTPKMCFLGEFDYQDLCHIVEYEKQHSSEIAIVCSDEFNLINAGKLRSEFNIPGHHDTYLSIYRDKSKMKELLKRANIRVPDFKLLTKDDNFHSLKELFGTPFVVKPIDSCGSHGVHIIREEYDFKKFITNTSYQTDSFEVEEYIDGRLYHVDSLIKEGELQFICANEYSFPNYEYTKGKVLASIPLDQQSDIAKSLILFATQCLNVLGANNLVNHMELFITKNNEIIFLEVSGRPPGAFLNLTHQINFGINLIDEDFFMQSGLEVSMSQTICNEKAFFALFPLLPGIVNNLNTPVVDSEFEMNWHVAIGDLITENECKNIVGKAAHAIFSNADENLLRDDFETIKHFKAIEVVY